MDKKSNVIFLGFGSVVVFLVAIFLTACGESTTEKIVEIADEGTEIVSTVKDLPKCTKDNEGSRVWVKSDSSDRICVDGKWFATKESSKDSADVNNGVSCTTKELKDKSGVKIICNGDSVGVVLNGKNGASGSGCSVDEMTDTTVTLKCGDNSTILKWNVPGVKETNDTLELDSEKVAVSMDSLAGVTQKGPFLKGATVYLYELSDGRTLKQTNGNFRTDITQDNGRFKFTARNLTSQYALLVVDGNYRNEVTGKPSAAKLQLRAISDVLVRRSANVNLLTHLEFDRVYYLVTHDKKRVKQAKKIAQEEILKEFGITLDGKTDAEDMNVFGTSEADAALLAVSVLLQGDGSETDLSVLLTEISNDMETDGKWDGKSAASLKAQIADWAAMADGVGRLDSIRKYVAAWGLGEVPDFEKYVRNFYSTETGLGTCGSKKNPVGTVKGITNSNSAYNDKLYSDSANMIRFVCDDAEKARWRLQSDIEKDTLGWGDDMEGSVRNGRINANLTYVYQGDHWRHGTAMDSLLVKAKGSACLTDGDTSKVKYDGLYYMCTRQTVGDTIRKWVVASDIFNDTWEMQSECKDLGKYGFGNVVAGRVNTERNYVCEKGVFRLVTSAELAQGRVCVGYINNQIYKVNGVFRKCTAQGWKSVVDKDTAIVKDAVGQKYRTVIVGTQQWMGQNVNMPIDSSGCYENNPEKCAKYGRLYTWDEAMKACPVGWHIPTLQEWNVLCQVAEIGQSYVDSVFVSNSGRCGKRIRSQTGWKTTDEQDGNGKDAFNLSIMPSGGAYPDYSHFYNEGVRAHLWSSTMSSVGNVVTGNAFLIDFHWDNDSLIVSTVGKNNNRFSARCVQDD